MQDVNNNEEQEKGQNKWRYGNGSFNFPISLKLLKKKNLLIEKHKYKNYPLSKYKNWWYLISSIRYPSNNAKKFRLASGSKWKWKSLSRVRPFATLEFSRPEY